MNNIKGVYINKYIYRHLLYTKKFIINYSGYFFNIDLNTLYILADCFLALSKYL